MPLIEYLTDDVSNLTVLVWAVSAAVLLAGAGLLAAGMLRRGRPAAPAPAVTVTPHAAAAAASGAAAWDGITRIYTPIVACFDGRNAWWLQLNPIILRDSKMEAGLPDTLYVRHQRVRDGSSLFESQEMTMPYSRVQMLVRRRVTAAEPMFCYVPLPLAPILSRQTIDLYQPVAGESLTQPASHVLRTIADMETDVRQQRRIMADEYGIDK